MEELNQSGVVPENYTGKVIDAAASKEFASEQEAKDFYQVAKERLTHVNGWHELAGTLSGEFTLTDSDGKELKRSVREGDYFKINITGPGNPAGDGYDWVRVEAYREVHDGQTESIGFRVRPVPAPVNEKKAVAHFYTPESTSSFTVTREGKKVTAGIYDRNIEANTEGSSLLGQIRNAAVGVGAEQAFSKLQWQALVDAIMSTEA